MSYFYILKKLVNQRLDGGQAYARKKHRTIMGNEKKLSPAQQEELLDILKNRFEKHPKRHIGIEWTKVGRCSSWVTST